MFNVNNDYDPIRCCHNYDYSGEIWMEDNEQNKMDLSNSQLFISISCLEDY